MEDDDNRKSLQEMVDGTRDINYQGSEEKASNRSYSSRDAGTQDDEGEDESDIFDNLIGGSASDPDYSGGPNIDVEGLHNKLERQNTLIENQSNRQKRQLRLMVVLMVFHTLTLVAAYYTATSEEVIAGAVFLVGASTIGVVLYGLRTQD